MFHINQMLNNSFNAPEVSMVQLVLRKMPKDTFNLLKQHNQTKNLNNKNDNSLYNTNNQLVSNGTFAKNVKMSLSKTNSVHQRNHSFSDIFIR